MSIILAFLTSPLGRWIAGALAAACALLAAWGYVHHLQHVAAVERGRAEAAELSLFTLRAQAKITTAAETAAVASQERIRTVTQTIIKRVPYAVTAKDDAACGPVPAPAVRLLTGESEPVPGPTASTDAAGSGVALSDLVRHDLEGRGAYEETADRLMKLQQWVRDQKALSTRVAP